ncbi:non-ribosomal peptide synthetase [Nostoc sp. NZL]|uniref:non-ribosomal peptide synthetase n=1 Tax=Nostoc sp. NZL TaxID=2650612 RepID=UPI0018C8018A|nr:non-ribosomal peptide synthetase [Nostoc sp. NZL]MBG1243500.1 amino acid adenylation domain-containing protein [Nostoc sp. NZL]
MKNIEDFYPLSPMQQGILFHALYTPKSGVYCEQFSCNIHGHLNISLFKQAWQQVVERHQILRTSFIWEGLKEPAQVVHKQVGLPWEQQDWQGLTSVAQQERMEDFLKVERERGFELSQPPLMRLSVIQLGENDYRFIWSHHHLLLDGWSSSLLLNEVFALYKGFTQGENLSLERPRPFRDYIAWLQQQDLADAEIFWRQRLKGFSTLNSFRVDRKTDNLVSQSNNYDTQHVRLSEKETSALQQFARQQQFTLNTLLQGAWAILLSRYSGEHDVNFGAIVSGRPPTLAGTESMVGLFINTLPMRVCIHPEESLLPWLKRLQTEQIEARQYEYSPLVKVLGWSDMPNGLPLFESIFNFQDYSTDFFAQQQFDNLQISNFCNFAHTHYPLTVSVEVDSELLLEIEYDRQRFDSATITRMLEHLQTLLAGMVANPKQRLADLPLLTAQERHQLLVEWNNTQADYSQICIHQLFEAQVERTPDAVAVVFEQVQLTYRELNQRANQLANYLQKQGVGPEVLVGICVERSLDMIIGLLGILKAGGAYVPLDPTYPQERLALMLKDTQVSVILTQERLLSVLPEHQQQVVLLDTDWSVIAQESWENLVTQTQLDNLAYIIYTSGSTGTPKGVMIEHRSLVNYIETACLEYEIKPSDRILQFASISFDAAAEEIFPCLIQGATLVLRTDEMLSSIPTFVQQSRHLGLTVLDLPTAFWHQLTAEISAANLPLPETLRLVIIGGERAEYSYLEIWQQHVSQQVRLVNSYGPTESTIVATHCDLSGLRAVKSFGRELPIGKVIQNAQTYVLNSNLQLTPVGVPGELYIGGVGVARGYLNQPERTALAFISNPFDKAGGSRLYKTGDLVRYLPDGKLEFLGRIDHQVKIRGFRIELGEIEAALTQYSAVQQAVVIAQADERGHNYLVAYVLPNQEQTPTITELRHFLEDKLPNYMMPSVFIFLEEIPLLPNGKLNRHALPTPDNLRPQLAVDYVMPKTERERAIANIWQQVLNVEKIGIHDNFFELGGNSLLMLQIHSQLRKVLSLELSLPEMFQYPTINSLIDYFSQANNKVSYSERTEKLTEGKQRLEQRLKQRQKS